MAASEPAFHALPPDEVLSALDSSREGLAEEEAAQRLRQHGPNALPMQRPEPAWKILLRQLRSVVVALLVAALAVSLAFGEHLDAAAIGAVLLLNTLLGFFTEMRARRALAALLRLESPVAVVTRAGQEREIEANGLVPGDIIRLDEGRRVPADARLLETEELQVNEAALTGESEPVTKHPDAVAADAPLPERADMVYQGTVVTSGTAVAVVAATGAATELGRIGGLLGAVREERTPLERRLDALGHRLVWLALAVAALVAGLGALRGLSLHAILQTGIALAVAAVPESLPAVATIALAVGVHRMARRRALVRRLAAVETLGSVTVICTDKTGTLTSGSMTATTLWLPGRDIRVTGSGYQPEGEFFSGDATVDPAADKQLSEALRIGALANRAELVPEDGSWSVRGDPTEGALLVLARKAGLERDDLLSRSAEQGAVPFTSERMLMATFHDNRGTLEALVKGAPGRVIELCTSALDEGGGTRPLDDEDRRWLLERNVDLASRGLRVLALARAEARSADEGSLQNLTFVGFVGLIDAPAEGVEETIAAIENAGIRVVMLTGDQQRTAEAIARQLGVMKEDQQVLDGREVANLKGDELVRRLDKVAAISRVSPEHKLDIVAAFQQRGDITAMLGDGVNDAPALRKADVGVAMGRRGTDVAKEAAAVVLQDDRFQTIGAAVEEGRVIFDNLRRFVFYLFSCNLAEILVLLAAGLAGLPAPLEPLQILWLNLVTDTFPALALAFEPAEGDVMRRPPRAPQAAILSAAFLRRITLAGAVIGMVSLAAFLIGLQAGPVERAVTLSFMTLALAQTFHLVNARSERSLLSWRGITANPWALGAVMLVVALQLTALYLPALAELLRVRPLAAADWLIVVSLALVPAALGQVLRMLRHRAGSAEQKD